MDRRRFLLASLTGIIAAPLATEAQPAGKVYRIGLLSRDLPPPGLLDGFRDRLRELGYVEGRTFAIELRNAEGSNERLHLMAEELVRSRVDIIVTVNTPAAHAAKKATATIPIIITRVADPVKSGLVPTLSRPGGNITGVSFMPDGVIGKVLQLLKEAIPGVARLAALWSADNAGSVIVVDALQAASGHLGVTLLRFPVDARDYSKAIQAALQERAEAVIVVDDARITMDRMLLVGLAAKHSLPVASLFPPLAEAGGLIAYGPSTPDLYRRAADYVDRILRGSNPSALPIEQPTKFHLTINMKAAKALGITIPRSLLLRADQVIE